MPEYKAISRLAYYEAMRAWMGTFVGDWLR